LGEDHVPDTSIAASARKTFGLLPFWKRISARRLLIQRNGPPAVDDRIT
jgi:hypothetical protein